MIPVDFSFFNTTKYWALGLPLILIPFYTWKSLFDSLFYYRAKYKAVELHHERHNCVVMYFKNRGASGWPPFRERRKLHLSNVDSVFEPLMYFISTAERSLDISVMLIDVEYIIDELIKARKRGVKIRFICDMNYALGHNKASYKNLLNEGVEITFFVTKNKTDQLMHHKYIIKDYSDYGGYLCIGSFNITYGAFIENFEDLVFLKNFDLIKTLKSNFEETLKFIKKDNQEFYKKTMLQNAGFC